MSDVEAICATIVAVAGLAVTAFMIWTIEKPRK